MTIRGSVLIVALFVCSAPAWAQQSIVGGTRARITDRIVVGGSTFGEVMRIVGSPTVSSGTGTMNPAAIDADGDVLEDSNTTVSTAGAWTWGGAGSFTSTLGVTGATTLSSTLSVAGVATLQSALPSLFFRESDQAASAKNWAWEADAGSLYLRLYDDTPSSSNAAVRLDRTSLVPGDWRWGSLLSTIRPENNGTSTLGSITKMYSAAYIWDLVAHTLTAKEVVATIGGEVIVAPTTSLTRDIVAAGGFIYVKHNLLRINDTVALKVNGSGEKMLVTGAQIDCRVSGNCLSVADDWAYAVTRNRQGSGAKDWLAGAAVVNEGNVGDGMISWFADRSSTVSDGYVGLVVPDGPVAYWRMNETTSTTTADVMGNVGVATETGTQSTGLGTTGLPNLGTTGADPTWSNTSAAGYLLVANDSDLQITGDLTIEFLAAWQASPTPTDVQHVISKHHSGEYHVAVNTDGSLQFCHGNTSTFTCYNTAAGVVTSSWTHYAVVRDSVSSPKRLLFYKNGALIHSTTYTQAVATTTNALGIGQNPSNTGFGFDGWIDEVAIYNYQVAADRLLLHNAARSNDSISRFTIGPTGCGIVRTGTGAFDESERWCIGNLAGTYGYASSTTSVYGFASGDPSATWISADATNGFRVMNGSTEKLKADTSGNLSMTGDLTIGTSGVFRSAAATALGTGTGLYMAGGSTPTFRVGVPSGNQVKWDGTSLAIQSERLLVNSTGISLTTNSATTFDQLSAYRFTPTSLTGGDFGVLGYDTGSLRGMRMMNHMNNSGTATWEASVGANGGSQLTLSMAASAAGGTNLFLTGILTTGNSYGVLVHDSVSGNVFRKTDGFSGSCANGTYENGILVSCP